MDQSLRYDYLKEMADHEFAAKLNKTKEERQKVEENVMSLRNRIKFLQNEEAKILTKIDQTIVKADEVVQVKNYAKTHSELLDWAKRTNQTTLVNRKTNAKEMKEQLENGLHVANRQVFSSNKRGADTVRSQLEVLNDEHECRRRAEFNELVRKTCTQRESEKHWIQKKQEMLESTINMSRTRFDSEITSQHDKIEELNAMIP